MRVKITNFLKEYDYVPVEENGSQYDKRCFNKYEFVTARHIKTPFLLDNPLRSVLPPAPDEAELARASTFQMEFAHDEIIKLPATTQLEIISQLKDLFKIYLPMIFSISINIRECLNSSYSHRKFKEDDPALAEIKDPVMMFPRCNDDSRNGTNGGCQVVGISGCGKSTTLNMILSFYPQGVAHPLENGGEFHQIIYLKVDCPDGNISRLYIRIGKEIDSILRRNHLHTFENMLKGNSKTTNADRANTLIDLVNSFGIGLIILDEAQNLKFNDKAIIDFLNVSNTTGVNFMFVSTQFLYPTFDMTEDNMKIVRRFGTEEPADRYCSNPNIFYSIILHISKYQLFDPIIQMVAPKKEKDGSVSIVPVKKYMDVLNEIYSFSQGRIEGIVKLWIEMNKMYVEGGRTDTVNKEFVQKVIHTRLHHLGMISEKDAIIQRRSFKDRLLAAIYKDDIPDESRIDDNLSDADRTMDIYCIRACNVINELFSTLKNNGSITKSV